MIISSRCENRVDAIFDLDIGLVKTIKAIGTIRKLTDVSKLNSLGRKSKVYLDNGLMKIYK